MLVGLREKAVCGEDLLAALILLLVLQEVVQAIKHLQELLFHHMGDMEELESQELLGRPRLVEQEHYCPGLMEEGLEVPEDDNSLLLLQLMELLGARLEAEELQDTKGMEEREEVLQGNP